MARRSALPREPVKSSVRNLSMNKARVLFAWERGNNLGHISGLVALSRKFTQANAKPVWAMPTAKRRLIPSDLMFDDIREAPTLSPLPDSPRRRPCSYAEVLALQGFGNRPALQAGLGEWRQLLEETAPALVVVDGAPTAQLAAYLFGRKCVQISNGFDAPPSYCPPFGYGLRGPMINEGNRRLIADIDRNISDAATLLGGRQGASLAGCLEETTRLVARVAEADPYGVRNDVSYVGPVTWPGTTESAVWPASGENRPKVFAYLRGPVAQGTVRGLAEAGASVLCFCPDRQLEGKSLGPFVRVVGIPVSMEEVFRQAVAVASYGATTLVCQTLLAGLPQLIVPADVEKWMVAQQLVRIGAGVMALAPDELPAAIGGLFKEATAEAAQKVASGYSGENWEARLWQAVVEAGGFSPEGQVMQTMNGVL